MESCSVKGKFVQYMQSFTSFRQHRNYFVRDEVVKGGGGGGGLRASLLKVALSEYHRKVYGTKYKLSRVGIKSNFIGSNRGTKYKLSRVGIKSNFIGSNRGTKYKLSRVGIKSNFIGSNRLQVTGMHFEFAMRCFVSH